MRNIFEFCGFVACFVLYMLIYTIVGCCITEAPFPLWLRPVCITYIVGVTEILLCAAVVYLHGRRRVHRGKRMGYIRLDENGAIYYE